MVHFLCLESGLRIVVIKDSISRMENIIENYKSQMKMVNTQMLQGLRLIEAIEELYWQQEILKYTETEEKWCKVAGFDNYVVSTLGRVINITSMARRRPPGAPQFNFRLKPPTLRSSSTADFVSRQTPLSFLQGPTPPKDPHLLRHFFSV